MLPIIFSLLVLAFIATCMWQKLPDEWLGKPVYLLYREMLKGKITHIHCECLDNSYIPEYIIQFSHVDTRSFWPKKTIIAEYINQGPAWYDYPSGRKMPKNVSFWLDSVWKREVNKPDGSGTLFLSKHHEKIKQLRANML